MLVNNLSGVVLSELGEEHRFISIQENSTFKEIESAIEKASGFNAKISTERFRRLRLTTFLKVNSVTTDLYLKISETKFVKILNKNEMYSSDIILKYQNRGVQYLYVESSEFQNLFSYFQSVLRLSLNTIDTDFKLLRDIQLSSIGLVHEAIEVLGFSAEVFELTQSITISNLKFLKKMNCGLYELVEGVIKQNNYLYEHSLLISYVAIEIARKMDWCNTSTFQKLSMAALLHDLVLDSELAEWHDLNGNLSNLDWKKIKKSKTIHFISRK